MTGTGRGLPVTGPKLIYTEDGKHAYAYSGLVQSASSSSADIECLNFQTGPDPIHVRFDYGTDYGGNNDMYIEILLNGISIWKTNNTTSNTINDQPIKFIIPPLTTLVFNWGINGVTKNISILMSGRVLE